MKNAAFHLTLEVKNFSSLSVMVTAAPAAMKIGNQMNPQTWGAL